MKSYYKLLENIYFDKFGREWYKVGFYFVLGCKQKAIIIDKNPSKLKLNENKPQQNRKV